MKLLISILFASLGLCIGYLIPLLSHKIIEFKKISIEYKESQYLTKYIKIVICIFNGVTWYYSFSSIDNIMIALLISMQITLGIMVAYIDVKIRIIPNELVLSMIALGIMFQITYFGFKSLIVAIICMVVMMIVFTAVAGFVGFGKVGAGDVKLAGAMGLCLSYPLIITAIGIMAISLLGFILTGMALKKIYLSTMLPFAPFMITGYIAALASLII